MNKTIVNLIGVLVVLVLVLLITCIYPVLHQNFKVKSACDSAQDFQYWLDKSYEKLEKPAPVIVSSYNRSESSIAAVFFGGNNGEVQCGGSAVTKDGKYVKWVGSVEELNVGVDGGAIGNAHIVL